MEPHVICEQTTPGGEKTLAIVQRNQILAAASFEFLEYLSRYDVELPDNLQVLVDSYVQHGRMVSYGIN